ncbi:MAG: PAS domain S-box protein, partial [Rhodothermaceae bacterium]
MNDKKKTKAQLIEELNELRKKFNSYDEKICSDFIRNCHLGTEEHLLENLSVLNSVNDGILIVDLEQKGIFINDLAKQKLEFRSSDILKKKFLPDIFIPSEDITAEEILTMVLKNGKSYTSSTEKLIKKDGHQFYVTISVSPFIKAGNINGAVISFTDITETKL